jgi:hypothetical protein
VTPEAIAFIERVAERPLAAHIVRKLEDPFCERPLARMVLDARIARMWQELGRPEHSIRTIGGVNP